MQFFGNLRQRKIFVTTKIMSCESILRKQLHYGIFKVNETSSINYFLEGLTSYEGENWFDENPVEYYVDQGIFETEEDAKEHLRKYNEWYHSDDENNEESNN